MSTPAEKAMAAGVNVDLVMDDDGQVQVAFLLDKVKNAKLLSIRDDDILLFTYPKSGTHWTWEIINMIVAGKAEYAKHWQNSAWLEYRTHEELEALSSPRILHTHLRPSQLPDAVWDKRCKVVYVRRNPKDCVVSLFCQYINQIWIDNTAGKRSYTGTWDDFIDLFLKGLLIGGSYFKHAIEWANISEAKTNFEICKLHFEDMKNDCVQEIRKMADYLGKPLSEKTYRDIAEACSFKNLKYANEKIKDQTYHVHWQDGSDGYFRKGQYVIVLCRLPIHVGIPSNAMADLAAKLALNKSEKAMAAGFNVDLVMDDDGLVQVSFLLDKLKNAKFLSIRDDDILLCTYPKSGTHWTWEIINMIVAGKAEYAKHWQNSAWLEYRTVEELEALASPRILHTHLRPSQLPDAVWEKRCKVVYVRRNPKDSVVSSFSQASKQVWKDNPAGKPSYTGTWGDFIDVFLNVSYPGAPYFEHTLEWTNVSQVHEDFEICTVHYEDMKKDCVREIRRMASYLRRPLSDKTYQYISEACSFKNLKHANEQLKDQTYHFQWQEGSSGYFRKGITGDWKNWFMVAQSERFDKVYEERLKEKFPY